jgi:hypothetical protein
MRRLVLLAAAGMVLGASAAGAAEIPVVSYSSSPGADCCAYADAGGVELTDGVISDRHFFADVGPYVAWDRQNPTITFTFDGEKAFGSLVVWIDDNHGGAGVTAPSALSALIDGVTYTSYTVGAPLDAGFDYTLAYGDYLAGGGTPYRLDLEGAVGSTVALTLTRGGQWTFVSEVDFLESEGGGGVTPVPEPAAWALMIAGFGGAGAAVRRRRRISAGA